MCCFLLRRNGDRLILDDLYVHFCHKGKFTEKRFIWLLLFCFVISLFLNQHLLAQNENDSSQVRIKLKSPTGAVLRSLVFPGWGQWYNGQKLKAFLVLGIEGVLLGNIFYYQKEANISTTIDEQNFYLDVKNQFIWYLVAAHLLNLIDAYVDANLSGFDTGPDLSFQKGDLGQSITKISLNINL